MLSAHTESSKLAFTAQHLACRQTADADMGQPLSPAASTSDQRRRRVQQGVHVKLLLASPSAAWANARPATDAAFPAAAEACWI